MNNDVVNKVAGEAVNALTSIDQTIIVVYLIGVLLIGAFFSRYVHSAGDFFLAGKALPFWAVGMSIVVSDIGAIDLVSGAGATYKYGIAQANFDWIGSMPAAVIAAFIFVPYYWRAGVYTIPEFLGRRYNFPVQLLQAVLWLSFLAVMLAVMLHTSAVFLDTILNIGYQTAVWGTVAIVGIYTVTGGLAAVVMTDVMQMVVMFVGTGSLLVLALREAGNWENMKRTVTTAAEHTSEHFTLLLPHTTDSPYPWTGIVFGLGIVLSTGYFVGNQAIVQRTMGARTEWDAKAGMLFAGFLKLFIPVLVFIPGLAAVAIQPDLADPDTAVPTLVRDLMPAGLRGLMFAAFFAALMSSVDSYLNSATTVFTSDIYARAYRRLNGQPMSQTHGLYLGRGLTVALILVAGLTAPVIENFETIYVAIQTMLSLFQGPTLAILLLGILWHRTTGIGALVGLICGIFSTWTLTLIGDQVFPSEDPFLFISFWTFILTLVITTAVSLVTPPEPEEKIRGLVFGQVMRDADAQALLQKQVDEK